MPFPLGKLCKPRALVVHPADRAPFVMLNRYPGQVIGVAFRLPDLYDRPGFHLQLSIVWAKPDRWF